MMSLIPWIGFSVALGLFAATRRNRSGVGWFFLSLLVSPLLALVFCLILPPKPPQIINHTTVAVTPDHDTLYAVLLGATALFVVVVIVGSLLT